jgi:hypothetical protein
MACQPFAPPWPRQPDLILRPTCMRHERARSHNSADEAVRAVRILQEVLGVSARIPASMLWKEHAVRVISPARARAPNVIGPEALRKVSTGHCATDVFNEPAHDAKCGIDEPNLHPRQRADPMAVTGRCRYRLASWAR